MTRNLPRLIQLIMTDDDSRSRVLAGVSENECVSLAMDIASRHDIPASEADLRAVYSRLSPKPAELSDEELELVAGGAGKGGDTTGLGGPGREVVPMQGSDGDDTMIGQLRDERMVGGAGDDTMIGSSFNWDRGTLQALGAQVPEGASQEELNAIGYSYGEMFGVTDDDKMFGGDGNDTMDGGVGNDIMYGGADNDTMYGGLGDDKMEGGDGDDLLDGGVGDDIMVGGSGNDILHGGSGNDVLGGGSGDDTLTGGEGNDVFIFSAREGNDTITDFTLGQDRINLQNCQAMDEFTVDHESGNTIITYGETTITVEGVQLSADDIWAMQK